MRSPVRVASGKTCDTSMPDGNLAKSHARYTLLSSLQRKLLIENVKEGRVRGVETLPRLNSHMPHPCVCGYSTVTDYTARGICEIANCCGNGGKERSAQEPQRDIGAKRVRRPSLGLPMDTIASSNFVGRLAAFGEQFLDLLFQHAGLWNAELPQTH